MDDPSVTPDSRGDLFICTWLFADSEEEETKHYQVRGRSSSEEFQAVYWRCVSVFFATSVRQQPSARHILFTNASSPPVVDGISVASLLESFDVEVVTLPLTFITPRGYYHEWRNQFYVFDILSYLEGRLSDVDSAMVLDSDCVWVSSVAPMEEALRRDGTLTYVVTYAPDWKINGLTRVDMSRIAGDLLGREVRDPFVYCGGELLATTGAELRRLAPEVRGVWELMLSRHLRGEAVFHEEGHTLSFAYFKLRYPVGNGDPFIRRIFTDSIRAENNGSPHDHGLAVWHVPLEKRLGIRRLFTSVTQKESAFWTLRPDVDLRRYLGALLGVPRNPIKKRALDLARRLEDTVRRR